jgi:release factor glutamine methyltransferase
MKSSRKKILFNNCTFYVFEDVYEPAEDTFLIAENLSVNENDVVLDVGTGCGLLAILAAKKARWVTAIDLNPYAVKCAKINAELNKVADRTSILRGDLFQPIRPKKFFTLILFNAPYLPSSSNEEKTWMEKAWSGGPAGRRLIDRFIWEAPQHLNKKGRILLVQSSLADINETLRRFRELGLNTRVLAEKRFMFETIVLIETQRQS